MLLTSGIFHIYLAFVMEKNLNKINIYKKFDFHILDNKYRHSFIKTLYDTTIAKQG